MHTHDSKEDPPGLNIRLENEAVRERAVEALRKIDPAAAGKAGVK
jgi:hypothetical protein